MSQCREPAWSLLGSGDVPLAEQLRQEHPFAMPVPLMLIRMVVEPPSIIDRASCGAYLVHANDSAGGS